MKSQLYIMVFLVTASTALNLDETPAKPGQEKKCTTASGLDGICLDEKYCTENQTVSIGGEIDNSAIRIGTCPKTNEWCCAFPNETKTTIPTPKTPAVPTVKPADELKCKTDSGADGICVEEQYCGDSLFHGGIIDDSSIRIANCPKISQVCCMFPNYTTTTVLPPTTSAAPEDCKLAPVSGNECPWCVAIYRDGNRPGKTATNRYCGGVLIGKRIVVTAAGCILSAGYDEVWVQAPSSPTPNRKYVVTSKIKHPSYNTGTREHDIGLLLLAEDLVWKSGIQNEMGACVGLQIPLIGSCFSVGYNMQDQIQMTKLSVERGNCVNHGGPYDAACGTAEGTCRATYGSPVLCPADRGGLAIAGVVRQPCSRVTGKTLLGEVMQSREWLEEQLKQTGLGENNYKS